MKDVFNRWAKTIGCAAFLGAMVATSTGCGALGAAANPKVAWALNDPAPMSVVVRRADVAEKTAQNVDKVLTDTPANDDSPWLQKVAPSQEEAAKQLADLRQTSYYQQGARVVPAEVWAKSLADLEPKDASKTAAKPAAKAAAQPVAQPAAPAPAPEPAKEPAKEPEPSSEQVAVAEPAAEPVAKAASPAAKPEKGKGKGKGKPAKVAVAPKPAAPKGDKKGARGKTAALADSRTNADKPLSDKPPPAPPAPPAPATAPAPAPATATAAAEKPAAPVSTTTTTSADVPAPAAPAARSASNAKYPSLLAAIDKDLASAWAVVIEKKKEIGAVKGQIATEEAALDVKGISDADKKAHKKNVDALEKQLSKLEKEADKLTSDFIPQAKAAAKKAPAEVREKFGAVLVNLQKAVDDANVANGAAAVRYPMAATTMGDSAQQMAAIYVADVIEEKTGKRPAAGGFQPNVSLEGTDVKLTINGLSQQDLGKISMTELTTEVTARTTRWVKHALGLLGTISSTKELLSFEDDVLLALLDGFKSSGWKAPAAATIPDAPAAAGAAPRS